MSNNGISSIIDNYGKIVTFIPLNIKQQKYLKINIPSQLQNLTIYHRLIYLFLIVCFIIAVFVNKKNDQYK